MKVAQNNRGQFVIIAVLMAAIMIVSIGAIMHNAATYYKRALGRVRNLSR